MPKAPSTDFKSAREFARSLNLKSNVEWQEFIKKNKPFDLPIRPDSSYKNKGWTSWGDFLGTGTVASRNRVYLPFKEAREFVRTLNLKGQKEWEQYYKSGNKPDDIPTHPDQTYKNKGYRGYGDWLGTGRIAERDRIFRSFNDARIFTHKLKLQSQSAWRDYCKSGNKPDDIPSHPDSGYKNNGWQNWGNWLGTGRIADQYRVYRPFSEAREFARNLKLKSGTEWKEYCKSGNKPDDIPANPHTTYKNKGWKNVADFLDTGNYKNKQYRIFEEAREFARNLGLKNIKEWKEYCKSGNKPDDIPIYPDTTYKNKGWNGYGSWLGNFINYLPFNEARKFVHTLTLKNVRKWEIYCKSGNKPDDIPARPNHIYKKNGWVNWGNWLGTFEIDSKQKTYRPFKEARDFVRSLNLKDQKEWDDYCKSGKKPDDIPFTPWHTYKEWNIKRRAEKK
jgi:hypothetical protein